MTRDEIEAEASKAAEQAFHFFIKKENDSLGPYLEHTEENIQIMKAAFAAGVLHGAKCQAKLEEIKEVLG